MSHIDLQIHFKLNPLMPRVEIHMHPAVPGELNLRVSMLLCRPKFDSPIALTALVPAVCPNSREWRNTSLFFSPPARVSCEEEEKKKKLCLVFSYMQMCQKALCVFVYVHTWACVCHLCLVELHQDRLISMSAVVQHQVSEQRKPSCASRA